MHVTIESKDLIDALKNSAVAGSTTMPVLTHVLLRTGDNELVVEATDMHARTQIVIPAEIVEPGAAVLPALRLSSAADGGGKVTIHDDGRVTRGRSRFQLAALEAKDFPDEEETEYQPVRVDPQELAAVIAQAAYAPEDGDVRIFCRALVIEPGQVTGGNGHKVVRLALDYEGPAILLPVKQLGALKGLLHKDAEVSVANVREGRAGKFRVRSGAHTVSIVCIDSTPYNIRALVDMLTFDGPSITLKRRELLDAVRRFAPFVAVYSKGDNGIVLRRENGTLTITDGTNPTNVEDVTDVVEQAQGNFCIGLSHRYTVSVLGAIGDDSIELYPHAHQNAALFMPMGGDVKAVAHLIAPQAIK